MRVEEVRALGTVSGGGCRCGDRAGSSGRRRPVAASDVVLPPVAELVAETGQGTHGVVDGERLAGSVGRRVARRCGPRCLVRWRTAPRRGYGDLLARRGCGFGLFRLRRQPARGRPDDRPPPCGRRRRAGACSGDAQVVVDAVATRLGSAMPAAASIHRASNRRSWRCSATEGGGGDGRRRGERCAGARPGSRLGGNGAALGPTSCSSTSASGSLAEGIVLARGSAHHPAEPVVVVRLQFHVGAASHGPGWSRLDGGHR